MNKRTPFFIFLNILLDVAEFVGIFFLADWLTDNYVLSVVITSLLAVLMLAVQLLASASVREAIGTNDEGELSNAQRIREAFDEIAKRLEQKYEVTGLTLIINPEDSINIGSGYTAAFNYKGIIAVANGAPMKFLKGLIAHEAGHAVSGLSNYSFLVIRPTHAIASLLKMIINALFSARKAAGFCRVTGCVLSVLYYIFMIPDFIAVVPFMRADEFAANEFAVALGYGEELRCAYREIEGNRGRLVAMLDLYHPSVKAMIEGMNELMELSDEEIPIYSVGKTIYSVDISAEDSAKAVFNWYKYRAKVSTDGYYSYMLGMACEKGNGTEKNKDTAWNNYITSLELGFAGANLRLGFISEEIGDIASAYSFYREYLAAYPDDTNAREHMKEINEKYFSGVYNCKLVSPAGKEITLPVWKSRHADGKFVWVISSENDYNVIHGVYTIDGERMYCELVKDGETILRFNSDYIKTREKIVFTGAIGKYTLVLSYDEI